MVAYLQISNDGVCDPVGFITLGVSTARDKEECIGQFGSGNKLAALVLLRNGIEPVIYCGNTKIKFFTKTTTMKHTNGEKRFEQVYVDIDGKIERLSISLDFGALDWTDVKYSVREIISNALDQSNQDASKISVEIVDKIIPHPEKTVVGIPLTEEIRKYYRDLKQYFLHFSPTVSHTDTILSKTKMGPARIYRKGVYVKTIESQLPSNYDYNFGSNLKIDESRTLDTFSCEIDVFKALTESDKIGEIFQALVEGVQCWETNFSNYEMNYIRYNDKAKELWTKVWKELYGDAVIAMDQQGPLVNSAKQKGYIVHVIRSMDWYKSLSGANIPTVITVLDNVNDLGYVMTVPTKNTLQTLDRVWGWLENIHLTRDKPKPPIHGFKIITQESIIMGYVKDAEVYINEEYDTNEHVMIHELCHYITGATDNTQTFQEFAFQISVAFARLLEETEEKLLIHKESSNVPQLSKQH